jgi:ATP-dependent protease ClpP protease subunit
LVRYKRLRMDDETSPAPAQTETVSYSSYSQPAQQLELNVVDNHIYFYQDIDQISSLSLIKSLRAAENIILNEANNKSLPSEYPLTPIWLHIMSNGGDLFSSFAISDLIHSMKVPVYSVIEGVAASGATVISMSCNKRYIMPNAFFMIHQFSGGIWGTYEEHKDSMKLDDMAIQTMIDFYSSHSKMKKSEIKKMLKHDSWLNSTKALELGFVDYIFGKQGK